MADIKTIYGIHSVTLLDYETHVPIIMLKAVGGASMELSGESTKLTGGSSLYDLDSEVSKISSEMSFTAREYPGEAMALLLGGTKTDYASNAAGQIVGSENLVGTPLTAITVSLTSGDSADLKAGTYVVKCTGANTVAVYALSDIGGGDFEDEDALEIDTSATLSATPVVFADYGFSLTSDASPDLTTGDAFRFTIIEPDMTGEKIKVGALTSTFDEYAALICAQKRGNGKQTWLLAYRVKAYGMPIQFEEKKFSEWQIKMEILYDANQDGVFEFVRQF